MYVRDEDGEVVVELLRVAVRRAGSDAAGRASGGRQAEKRSSVAVHCNVPLLAVVGLRRRRPDRHKSTSSRRRCPSDTGAIVFGTIGP